MTDWGRSLGTELDKTFLRLQKALSALPPNADIRPGKLAIPYPVDLPFYSATIIKVSVQEACNGDKKES